MHKNNQIYWIKHTYSNLVKHIQKSISDQFTTTTATKLGYFDSSKWAPQVTLFLKSGDIMGGVTLGRSLYNPVSFHILYIIFLFMRVSWVPSYRWSFIGFAAMKDEP